MNMQNSIYKLIYLLAFTVVLSACGEGGGSEDSVSPQGAFLFTVDPIVSGLEGVSGQVSITTSQGTETLELVSDGKFSFPVFLKANDTYSVQMENKPQSPLQTCHILNATGVIANHNVSHISINCVTGPVVPVSPPDTPVNLLTIAGDVQVTLSWDTVSGADNYAVYWNTMGGVSTADNVMSAGSNLQINHTGLSNGTTYYYRIVASSAGGASALSSEASAVPVAPVAPPVTPPVTPSNVQAAAGNGQVALSWNTVSGADNYAVYWNTMGGVSTADNVMSAGSNLQINHTGLSNGATYYYRIVASNAGGASALSSEASAAPVAPVGPPENVRAIKWDGEFTLRWNSLAGASSYNVYIAEAPGVSIENYSVWPGGALYIDQVQPAVISGLTNGVKYYVTMAAVNAIGIESSGSVEINVTPELPITNPRVSAGEQHSVAVASNGMVWTWGNNDEGQLGDGTTNPSPVPIQVKGLSNIIAVKSSQSHNIALKSDGTVWAWGDNTFGQLGDGTNNTAQYPVHHKYFHPK
jgi:Tfp pilus assembly protein PilX